MFEATVASGILIIIVLILRQIFKKAVRPTVIYALWAIVALRLLMPFSLFESRTSVMNFVPQPEINFSSNSSVTINDALAAPAAKIKDNTSPDYFSFINLRFIWLSGAALAALCFIYANGVFTIRLYKTRKRIDTEIIPIYVSDSVTSPCLYGLFKPCIYLTPQSLENKDIIIKHELAHYRQRDNWLALVRCACICIHWFNPLVWLASAVSRIDGEISCDQRTIKAIGEEKRTEYGKLLIDMAAAGSGSTLCLATSLAWDKKQLAQRIKHIAKKPKNIIIAVALLAAFSAGAMLITFGSAKPEEKTSAPDNKPISEERIAAAEGFLMNAFTVPNKGFAEAVEKQDSMLTKKAMEDICGDYADKRKVASGGQLRDTILYLQKFESPVMTLNSTKLDGSGNVLNYVAYVTVTSEQGKKTDTEFTGILQFNQADKIDFFTTKNSGPPDVLSAPSLWTLLMPYANYEYDLSKHFVFQPSVHISLSVYQPSDKEIKIYLSGDDFTLNKYKKPRAGSSGENYHSQLKQTAFAALKLCPLYDTIVFSINSNFDYLFTREQAQKALADKWDMPTDTLAQFEEWFEFAKAASAE